MKLYDTMSREKKELKKTKQTLRLFVCGPTVYDEAHIGHARTYIAFDMFVKYMRHIGYNIFYLQNITDIDDKIIKRANEEGVEAHELARRYEKEYKRDMEALHITSVDKYARASDYIKEIVEQIKILLKKGYAYELEDGIYYDISKFANYGKLSGRTALAAQDAVSRIDEASKKKNKGDFALWKFSKPDEPKWQAPWGEGRPGWHIEDTALTHKEFKRPQYELHGGARDLIFPHHEAEIAQMEAAYEKPPMVEHWMHTGFLQLQGQKMSKSLKNFITIKDTLSEYSAQTLRIFFTTKLYRSPIDYNENSLKEARVVEKKLREFWKRLQGLAPQAGLDPASSAPEINEFIDNFWMHLENDFNTPRAFAELFQLMNYANTQMDKNGLDKKDAQKILNFLKKMNSIFAVVAEKKISEMEKIPADIKKLAEKREKLRQDMKWDEADKIREKLVELGYEIKDTDKGQRIMKKS